MLEDDEYDLAELHAWSTALLFLVASSLHHQLIATTLSHYRSLAISELLVGYFQTMAVTSRRRHHFRDGGTNLSFWLGGTTSNGAKRPEDVNNWEHTFVGGDAGGGGGGGGGASRVSRNWCSSNNKWMDGGVPACHYTDTLPFSTILIDGKRRTEALSLFHRRRLKVRTVSNDQSSVYIRSGETENRQTMHMFRTVWWICVCVYLYTKWRLINGNERRSKNTKNGAKKAENWGKQ